MFSLMGEKAIGQKRAEDDDVLLDDDVRKLDRLQLINASARYELLSANQQLIDFHLNRVMNSMFKRKQQNNPTNNNNQMQAKNIHNDVIGEVSEAEEQNQTTLDIGSRLHDKLNEARREKKEKYSRNSGSEERNILSE